MANHRKMGAVTLATIGRWGRSANLECRKIVLSVAVWLFLSPAALGQQLPPLFTPQHGNVIAMMTNLSSSMSTMHRQDLEIRLEPDFDTTVNRLTDKAAALAVVPSAITKDKRQALRSITRLDTAKVLLLARRGAQPLSPTVPTTVSVWPTLFGGGTLAAIAEAAGLNWQYVPWTDDSAPTNASAILVLGPMPETLTQSVNENALRIVNLDDAPATRDALFQHYRPTVASAWDYPGIIVSNALVPTIEIDLLLAINGDSKTKPLQWLVLALMSPGTTTSRQWENASGCVETPGWLRYSEVGALWKQQGAPACPPSVNPPWAQ